MTRAPWYRWLDDNLELRVRARTRSPNEGLGEVTAGAVPVRVNAPPVEGKANQRLAAVLADAFGVAKSRVRLTRGQRSRYKWFRIERPGRIPESLKTVLRKPSDIG